MHISGRARPAAGTASDDEKAVLALGPDNALDATGHAAGLPSTLRRFPPQ